MSAELDILGMYGMLDDVPDELMYEGSIAIQFESPAVHMQQSGAIVGLYKTMEAAAAMAQSNPDVLKVFDMEAALRKIADYYGVGSDVVKTADDMAAIQQQEALQGHIGAAGRKRSGYRRHGHDGERRGHDGERCGHDGERRGRCERHRHGRRCFVRSRRYQREYGRFCIVTCRRYRCADGRQRRTARQKGLT